MWAILIVSISSNEAESDFCLSVPNQLLEKYAQDRLETKCLVSFTHIRFAICSKMQFTTEDIETIFECLGCEVERCALSKLGWLSKFEIENGHMIFHSNNSFVIISNS